MTTRPAIAAMPLIPRKTHAGAAIRSANQSAPWHQSTISKIINKQRTRIIDNRRIAVISSLAVPGCIPMTSQSNA
jgi:hypothetical protein